MGFNTKALNLLSTTAALAGAFIVSGCSTISDDEPLGGAPSAGVGQASRLGVTNNVTSGFSETIVLTNAAIIAKYEASAVQRKIAEERARRTYQKMSPEKKKILKSKKVRYIAVDTQKDKRIKGQKAVMVWDTQAESIVGNAVYDVGVAPPINSTAKFETYASEYVGAGT